MSPLFCLLEAENGKKALNILKEQEVDIIITDVMMPVMDGVKLCKQVKQNLRTCHIPVYMLSAKVDVKYQLEGLHVGADDYIAKPFAEISFMVGYNTPSYFAARFKKYIGCLPTEYGKK